MRLNFPISSRERLFPEHERLISVTDTQGSIVACNDAFVAASGFSRDELLGKPHNIVRHPDMPAQAFRVMWDHLRAGVPWMGMVKNRCKNGDYYWVDAYVSPITEQGRVVGYESVRSSPCREDVLRAERLYARLAKGPLSRRANVLGHPWLVLAVGLALAAGLFLSGKPPAALAVLILSLTVFGGWVSYRHHQAMQGLDELLGDAFRHELTVRTHSREQGMLGRLKVGIRSEKARLNTIITRIEDAAKQVAGRSQAGLSLSQQARESMKCLRQETEQVATAMHEMTATIKDVASHVQETAVQADNANQLATQGRAVAGVTREAIAELKQIVDEIGGSVRQLSEQSTQIARVAQMIEVISEQTNLLALNAAIEAARAGEQGRGFAVVADEVRQLASRTRDSTGEIHQVVAALAQRAGASVQVAERGKTSAEAGLARVVETEEMLAGISSSVGHIADMSMQMAAAVEQQAHVAEDINRQVVSISTLTDSSLAQAGQAATSIKGLRSVADELYELVVRLKH
ncbi:methyl-accepting chemotaxis protein [Zobellella iuensis]|uniref:Methyl-accepting chemotaxis protein n=1 Tax=Zobellella iuensis TaxID=2803811 RepID=A0ABS1QQX2_9GAMM|nr:PAS domain-containing methyl-accepting chemotaxis protein [Zobellella iuensis]MBL1376987.1 methyl-accepting chemotaxis protein [Zobellella iuensis]